MSRASAATAEIDVLVEDRAMYSSNRMLQSDGIQASRTPVPVRSSHRIECRQIPAPSETTAASLIYVGDKDGKPKQDQPRK